MSDSFEYNSIFDTFSNHSDKEHDKYFHFVSLNTLFQEAKNNIIKCESLYKNKEFCIKGTIEKIDKSFLGYPTIKIKTSSIFNQFTCYFGKEYYNEIAKLYNGKYISVYGRCSYITQTSIEFKNCKILE